MTEVGTVDGGVHKFQGRNWVVKDSGLLIVETNDGQKAVFAIGKWIYVRDHAR